MTIFELEQQLKTATHRFHPTESKFVIYFLLQNNQIVYVGKSSTRRYIGRIRSHLKNKDFDCYHVLPVEMSEAECYRFETSLISTIRPKYNIKDSSVNLPAIHKGIEGFFKSQLLPAQLAGTIRKEKHGLQLIFGVIGALSILFFCLFSFLLFMSIKGSYDFGVILISLIGTAISINAIIRSPIYYTKELKKLTH